RQASDDDPIFGRQPLFDDSQLAVGWAYRNATFVYDIVVVDDEHIAACLIAAERHLGHEQRLLLGSLRWRYPRVREHTGQQRVIRVGKEPAHPQRPGRGIDLRRDVIDDAFVRVAGIVHQPQFNGDFTQIGGADAARIADDAQHVLFTKGGGNIDRIEPQDGRERRWAAAADERADRGEMGRHDAVERCRYLGVAEFDFGQFQRGLRLLQLRPRLVAVLLGLV